MIDLLIDKIIEKNNPSVVGLDPRLSYVPDFITKEAFEKYGETPKAVAESFYEFNKFIIDAVADIVPAVKPQIAMYEQYGACGIESYIKTVEYAKEKGLIVIGDVKRGDIASTAEAYSDGHIGRVAVGENTYEIFKEDFITLNPYLGFDSVEPFLKNCRDFDKGLFMLIKTSNASSGDIQDLFVEGKPTANQYETSAADSDAKNTGFYNQIPLYEKVGGLVAKWGESLIGKHGYSAVGGVVGATYPEQGKKLRSLLPHTFFLVPGYGAQGGKSSDLKMCFGKGIVGAIVNSSRGIIAAHLSGKYKNMYLDKEFALSARLACIDMRDEICEALN